ncbi:hypothetical protein BV133_2426 [Blastochloris viridis]|uniref:Uncharacterized protein n=1 Tax=Blastochloris viridis TaxID=1079 RepID=A0A182D3J4_BLAVI|nr:hypothetical protein BV133_2426 [Blastochloris viridis]
MVHRFIPVGRGRRSGSSLLRPVAQSGCHHASKSSACRAQLVGGAAETSCGRSRIDAPCRCGTA